MTFPRHVAVVPSTPALLPAYGGLVDPVADLREHAVAATGWLAHRSPQDVQVLAAPQRPDNLARGVMDPVGHRVGRSLLLAAGVDETAVTPLLPGAVVTSPALLVVANGSAARSQKAPGHLDERAYAFDEAIADALVRGRPRDLTTLDPSLAAELWCDDVLTWQHLGSLATAPVGAVEVDYDGDPYGVRYWVVRWTCAS